MCVVFVSDMVTGVNYLRRIRELLCSDYGSSLYEICVYVSDMVTEVALV